MSQKVRDSESAKLWDDKVILGLRILALEDLLDRCAPDIQHDKERIRIGDPPAKGVFRWQCKRGCRKCLVDAAVANRFKRKLSEVPHE